MANKNPTSFRLAQDALDAIKELAALQGISQAEAVEYLAREWKKHHAAEAVKAGLEELRRRVAALESERETAKE
jgi:uncharacterized protein YoaH (UPF0181 family)